MFPCYNMATTMKSSTLENDIVLAAKAGFRHIELRKEKLLNYLQRGGTLSALKTLLEDNEIKPVCINALADITFHKGQARRSVTELCHFLCYAGQLVGCRDLEAIAAELHVSREHLSRVFRAQTGNTLGAFAAEERMRFAARLLRDRTISCKEIAERIGFESASSFARAFRMRYKVSPTQFLK